MWEMQLLVGTVVCTVPRPPEAFGFSPEEGAPYL